MYMCHSICLLSLVLDIRLDNLNKILARSGTHNLAHGALILLQLPLHLFNTMNIK